MKKIIIFIFVFLILLNIGSSSLFKDSEEEGIKINNYDYSDKLFINTREKSFLVSGFIEYEPPAVLILNGSLASFTTLINDSFLDIGFLVEAPEGLISIGIGSIEDYTCTQNGLGSFINLVRGKGFNMNIPANSIQDLNSITGFAYSVELGENSTVMSSSILSLDVTTGFNSTILGNALGMELVENFGQNTTVEGDIALLYVENPCDAENLAYGDCNSILSQGSIQAASYRSSQGNSGITASNYWLCTSSDCSSTCQANIQDGLIVGCT